MRKLIVLVGVLAMMGWWNGYAYAGVGDWINNSVTFLFEPVNCVLALGRNLVGDLVDFSGCVIGNLNRNPATLHPALPPPVPQP